MHWRQGFHVPQRAASGHPRRAGGAGGGPLHRPRRGAAALHPHDRIAKSVPSIAPVAPPRRPSTRWSSITGRPSSPRRSTPTPWAGAGRPQVEARRRGATGPERRVRGGRCGREPRFPAGGAGRGGGGTGLERGRAGAFLRSVGPWGRLSESLMFPIPEPSTHSRVARGGALRGMMTCTLDPCLPTDGRCARP
jgi:hypothetical protein